MRAVQTRVSDQGRHPRHVDRRGDNRAVSADDLRGPGCGIRVRCGTEIARLANDVKILLIRLRLIGDVVFTTPIPRALKRVFPDAKISYLVEEPAAPVLAGKPLIDEL